MSLSVSSTERHIREERRKLACEECRRRKLRCDGQQPRCGVCVEAGISCNVNPQRSARGPKKGLLRSLRIRAAELERRLQEHTTRSAFYDDQTNRNNNADASIPPARENSSTDTRSPNHRATLVRERLPVENQSQCTALLSDLVQADLTQLYFERVHPSTPFIHKRKFLSQSIQLKREHSGVCLQLAMWTLAASISPQYQHMHEVLYQRAREELHRLELEGSRVDSVDVKEAQAWTLIAIYEFLRMHYRRGWMSLGRTCRLVQLLGLHKIDGEERLTNSAGTRCNDTGTEERRRTFWMAFCLDRLVSMRNNWPLAFNELVICTRLPAPEEQFQDCTSSVGGFLSQEIADQSNRDLPPFTALIIFVTICGRCISHEQQAGVELVYGNGSTGFWDRHQWLRSLLTRNIAALTRVPITSQNTSDPMRVFAHMVAHTTLIYLYNISKSLPSGGIEPVIMPDFEQEALAAAMEIVNLTRVLDELSIFKTHPLTPYPIHLAAEFFAQKRSPTESFEPQIRQLLNVLHSLKPVSELANYYAQITTPSITNMEPSYS
ncbi:hypothetical protein Aspvir_003337 [Aspergillus viridinutans]|uniref:Zn(2)-C6 fungal-type domain-containing protein n=1 Tax=Aspergillus viridinutans TaxID=75553 RepID=A0A9P3C9W3_ASPVI|nr:uncharacterized protein Aspvir_003337 [Aspergillus viridinutans]GIK07671.1 hypothetical protein Aspvir_003337 [Aspergillus viridinutans]